MKSLVKFFFILGLISSIVSCKPQYLLTADYFESADSLPSLLDEVKHVIKTDDKLSLSIWNHDDLSIGSVFSIYNSNEAFGKWVLVQADGTAVFPKIGKLNVAGLTTNEAEELIIKAMAKTLVNPIVVVKVLNREVQVFGEVKNPGNYLLEKEKTTVGEMLASAGGYSDYANLKEIQLIRNNKSYLLDFTVLNSSPKNQLLMLQGDMLYIPPIKGKKLDQKAPTLIPFSSAITALVLLATLIL